MATFDFDKVDDYVQSQGEGFKFLKLADHNWSAKVRFMYGPGEIFQGHTTHNISTEPRKTKNVLCLREAGDPIEKCPLCSAGNIVTVQFYLPVYVISITECINGRLQPEKPVNEVMLFQRGKTFSGCLQSIVRQSQGTPIVNNIFNIVRNGKAGDMQTTYLVEFAGRDNIGLQDLPERPQVLGSYLLPEYDYTKMLEVVNGTNNASSGVMPRTIQSNNMNQNYNQNWGNQSNSTGGNVPF